MTDSGEDLQRSKRNDKRQNQKDKIPRNKTRQLKTELKETKRAKTQREMTNVDKGPITDWGGNQRVIKKIKRQKMQECLIKENILIHMKYILNDSMSWKNCYSYHLLEVIMSDWGEDPHWKRDYWLDGQFPPGDSSFSKEIRLFHQTNHPLWSKTYLGWIGM